VYVFSIDERGQRAEVLVCAVLRNAVLVLIGCSTEDSSSPTSVTDQSAEEKGSIAAITITTGTPAYLTSSSATVSGTAATDGAKIVERGVCFATVAKPTVANSVVTNGSGPGTYECVLGDDLPPIPFTVYSV
jgi:hypothetical protein